MIEEPTRVVHVNTLLDSVVRVHDFVTTDGDDVIHTMIAGPNYFFACGVAGGDFQTSVWRFTRDSFAQRHRDFAAAGGLSGIDAVGAGNGVLFLGRSTSGNFVDNAVIVVIDEELDSDLQRAICPRIPWCSAGWIPPCNPVGLCAKGAGFVYTGWLSATVVGYVEIESELDVVASRTITLGISASGTAAKLIASGDTLIMMFLTASQLDTILVCVNLSTHTVIWAKKYANAIFRHLAIKGTSVFAVGSGFALSNMLIAEISLAAGTLVKTNGFSAHDLYTGNLIAASAVGSNLWFK